MKAKCETKSLILRLKLAFADITALLGLDEQRNRLEPITAENVDPVDIDLAETVELGDAEAHKLAKRLRRATDDDRRNAFSTLLTLPSAIVSAALGWRVFLLCLLSNVADLVICAIPSLPVIAFTGLITAPRALRALAEAFNPFRELTGKKSQIQRPSTLEAVTPLGGMTVSSDPTDYFGGKVKVAGYGKLKTWLPLALVPTVVAANVPASITNALLAFSPLAQLIFCGALKINSSRFTFRWDGASFETFDLVFLDRAAAQMSIIQSEVLCFAEFIHAKEFRRNRIIEGMADFYPVAHSGRFTKILDATPEVRIWAAALSTLRELLRFASDQAGWCSREEAERLLLEAWTAVLPESAPTPPSENAVAVRNDSAEAFWGFLTDYIRGHLPLIADEPRSRPDAFATLAVLDDQRYIVLPRGQLVSEYNAHLDRHGGAPLSDQRRHCAGTLASGSLGCQHQN